MKNIYTLLLILSCSFYLSSAQYTWTQKAGYSGGVRYGAAAFSIGAKGYFGTGMDGNITLRQDFWEYDTLTNSWTQKADFGGGACFGAAALAIGNYGYIGLGTSSYPSYVWVIDFWQYDPTSNTWTQKANFPAHGRYASATFTIGNKGYIACGWYGPEVHDFWQYDPSTDTWTQEANVGGGGRESSSGFVINNKGYVALGLVGGSPSNDLWEYDTLANTWTQKTSFPGTARYGASAFVLCNDAYVGLGSVSYPNQAEKNDFWKYNASADSWTQITNFPDSARNGAVEFVIGDNAYIGTGAASTALSGFTNGFWQFNADSCSAVAVTPPVASFQSSDSILCANDCISFTDHSSNATSWQWIFNGATPSSSTVQNPYICYLSAGNYDVTLVASNSGGSDTVTLSNYINVNPAPPTPVITPMGTILYCSTDPSYTSYQWFDSTTLISGAVDTSLVITNGGNYNVQVTNANGCKIAVGITIILGIQNYINDNRIVLSPNPVNEKFTIHNLQFTIGHIEIDNVLGQICSQSHPSADGRNSEIEMDVSSLPLGVYFVQLTGDNWKWVGRFVKE